MSIHAISWVLKHSPVDVSGERLVLLVLADHASDEGEGAWPSLATIASESRMSIRNVRYTLRKLERDGHIQSVGIHPTGTTIYNLIMGEANLAGGQSIAAEPSTTEVNSSLLNGLEAADCLPPGNGLPPEEKEVMETLSEAADERGLKRPSLWSVQRTMRDFKEKDALAVARDCRYWLMETEQGRKRTDVARTYRTFMKKANDKPKPQNDDALRRIRERMGWK